MNQKTKATTHTISAQEQLASMCRLDISNLKYSKDDTIGAKISNVLIAYLFDEKTFNSAVPDLTGYIKKTYTKIYDLKSDAPADREWFKIDGNKIIVNAEIAPSIEQQVNQRAEVLEILLPASEVVGAINRLNKIAEFLKKDVIQKWNKTAISIKSFEKDYEDYIVLAEKSEKTKKAKSTDSRKIDDEFASLVSF